MSTCGPIKYTVSTPIAGAQAIIAVVGSTNTNLVRGVTSISFEDSAASIKLSFGITNDSSLVGTHTLKIEASLATFPEMDVTVMVSDTF